jgi:hypothetical protein
MTKVAILTGTVAILVAACHPSSHTDTRRRVLAVPHPTREAGEPDRVFAADLHHTLLARHVPHKVVTVEFPYQDDFHRISTARHTVVVYRDASKKGESWWLMDERLNVPVWLPNEPLERQISFYLARPATVVSVSDFTEDHSKIILPLDQAEPRRSGTSTIQRADLGAGNGPAAKPAGKASKPAGGASAPKAKSPSAESKIAPAAKPKEKSAAKAAAAKPAEKPEPKPIEKSPAKEKAVAVEKTTRPAAKETAAQPAKTEPASADTESSQNYLAAQPKAAPAPAPAKEAVKPPEKRVVKPAMKASPSGKPPVQPELFDDATTPTVPAKPAEKKSAAAKPASKATPNGKPATQPELFDRPDSTPKATIIDEPAPKKPDDADQPKSSANKPEASARKPNFLKRFFRRIFARHRSGD